jgi:hypothetical protein
MVHRLKNEPFAFVGVNSDGKADKVKPKFEKEGVNWRNAIDGTTEGPIAKQYRVQGWPTVYVIDAKGVIRAKDLSGEALDEKVDELLKELRR